MIEGKTKKITRLDPNISGKMWSAKVPPYPHLVNIETKDRLTANDAAIDATATVAAYKTNQTCDVFRYLMDKEIPTAFISQRDNYNFIARECEMFPYECVARRRAWGSFLKRKLQIQPGHIFGRATGGRYQDPLIEFFYKLAVAPNGEIITEDEARARYLRDGKWTETVHTDPLAVWEWSDWRKACDDENSFEEFKLKLYPPKQPGPNANTVLATVPSVITPAEYKKIFSLTAKTFMALEEAWKHFDVELIDMKIEFGRDLNTGEILVADVIDNDSWRIWPGGDHEKQLDKQSFRDGEPLDEVTEKYRIVTDYTKQFNYINK